MKLFEKGFPRAVQLAHVLVESRLRIGDLAVDATVGNGHDTLFLAGLVGETGRVVGFDIQEEAIVATGKATGHLGNVELHRCGHEEMAARVKGPVRAVMFNLGYLPGASHEVITRPSTTLAALEAAVALLETGGIITVVSYSGHEGGGEEASAVRRWAASLPQDELAVVEYGFLNQKNSPPGLLAIGRKK